MADHGRLFDNFSAQPSHTHGGSYFDAGFGLQTISDAHGKLYDLFGLPRDSSAHGERYDEFGWTSMPAIHGQQFDSDFRQPTAGDTEHGSWFDVFRGGTEVRAMVDGRDLEGVVVECRGDHAIVRDRAGQTHEVGLSQFLAYRTPNDQQCSPTLPESEADAPSARSADAHGAFGEQRTPGSTEMQPVVGRLPQGQDREPRSGLPDGLLDTFDRLKSLADELDVEKVGPAQSEMDAFAKAVPNLGKKVPCPRCAKPATVNSHDSVHCPNCFGNVKHPGIGTATLKSVDATETATQAQDLDGAAKGAWCPHCQHECKKVKDGLCPTCGNKVEVGKVASDGSEIPEREHKTTDHHGQAKRCCPHCGAALDALDHQTEQGQPSRRDKQGGCETFDTVTAHKCAAGGLSVLKTAMEAS